MYKQGGWCLYWLGLGVLSSVGLGTGLHTFLLYLGPHIASVTLAAYECGSLNFPEPPYPDQWVPLMFILHRLWLWKLPENWYSSNFLAFRFINYSFFCIFIAELFVRKKNPAPGRLVYGTLCRRWKSNRWCGEPDCVGRTTSVFHGTSCTTIGLWSRRRRRSERVRRATEEKRARSRFHGKI